ncbi:hypothetical protein [Paractinoplanes atraurantiacus]|uniref:Uncharacterized protein n=1 Tax=Paractinoplanes atraurantiacus TaxID=1036182 RepID=A0A285HTM0_9ACTN|nr:hypothetical protein [Actinoplanes atraurantiacus]SNY39088.1 hypothetical protein SAMN05421748_105306 [Actinoplanes atraurantiacus]
MAVIRVNGCDEPVKVAVDPDDLIHRLNSAAELGTTYIVLPVLNKEDKVIGQYIIRPEAVTTILIVEDGRSVHMDTPQEPPQGGGAIPG